MNKKAADNRNKLELSGVSENNLKQVDCSITHDNLTVITGLSGSGKSSLAFDTVYAEGQRRYIETFSPYTRQFLDKIKKPTAQAIKNVRPAIAIQQRTRILNSRSTVGSLTHINDYLRVFWSLTARPVCPDCNFERSTHTPEDIYRVLKLRSQHKPAHKYVLITNIKLPKSKKAAKELIKSLITRGFSRAYSTATQEIIYLEESANELLKSGELQLILDRYTADTFSFDDSKNQVIETINTAYGLGAGNCSVLEQGPGRINKSALQIVENRGFVSCSQIPGLLNFSKYSNCPNSAIAIPKIRQSLFSYNHPLGACTGCRGFGFILKISEELCVPDPRRTISEGALKCWEGAAKSRQRSRLLNFCKQEKISTKTAWQDLTDNERALIFNAETKTFLGVNPWFKKLEQKSYKMHVRVFLAKFRKQVICPECNGGRLVPGALAYRFKGKALPELWSMQISDLQKWLSAAVLDLPRGDLLWHQLSDVLAEIQSRLNFLIELGLPYLTLDRLARTLSGGETQRVNLTAALGSNLTNTHFVLDEPSVGLHARDSQRLIKAVKSLKEQGNSVLVVEHDPELILAADEIIEIGPLAGKQGGEIVYSGELSQWSGADKLYLAEQPAGKIKTKKQLPGKDCLEIQQASARNLKGLSCKIPLKALTCISGVSGSGKSTLVTEVLLASYAQFKLDNFQATGAKAIKGFDKFSELVFVDQSPLSKTPRANIATYTGIWDEVRTTLEKTESAQQRGLNRSSFSFNSDAGRCPACKGAGHIKEDMQFLSDVFVPCELCAGQRFKAEVLELTYQGKNVHELLQTSAVECGRLFPGQKKITAACDYLERVGLGYLHLGHPLSELSGGEAQRLKLVPYLKDTATLPALLIFDEPTVGLHTQDVARLLQLFRHLIDLGHTVVCVEHNLEVINNADWVIDLGPEGGSGGGQLMFEGSPEDLKKSSSSETAEYLAKLGKHSQTKLARPALGRSASNLLSIQGAREHNLKNISTTIPLNKIVAVAGVSGSGKSTLARDIIFAEGQRRYLDCLSPYARQFIKGLQKADFDRINFIPPTIYVGQHTSLPSLLSTVATMSEAYNYLRLLYAKLGTQFCPNHPEQRISNFTAEEIAENLITEKSRVKILAPIVKKKKGFHKQIFARALEEEITEVRVDGKFGKSSAFIEGLDKTTAHTIEYVVATCVPKNLSLDLLTSAIAQTLALGAGNLIVWKDGLEQIFSSERSCPQCQQGFFKPDPEDFSFSSRRGACPSCEGKGVTEDLEVCQDCAGTRINPAARNVRLGKYSIGELCNNPPSFIKNFVAQLKFDNREAKLAHDVMLELNSKLSSLIDLDLDHIELSRDCRSLSAGELQRLRMVAALGSPLSGVLYIFDEPSANLHPIEMQPIINTFKNLKARGNSILLIEHDQNCIKSSDHIIEIGPGAGRQGGELVFNDSLERFKKAKTLSSQYLDESAFPEMSESLATRQHSNPQSKSKHVETLELQSQPLRNLSALKLTLPLQSLNVIAGVSGAGKSTLLHGIIAQTLLDGRSNKELLSFTGDLATIKSSVPIKRTRLIDQGPLGKNSRSTPASFLGIWNHIRDLFATTSEAKALGWSSSFFSYNTGKGRCPGCEGRGELVLEMNFLANARIPCDQCGGSRFSEAANGITFNGLSPAQVLQLTFIDALEIFKHHRKISHLLKAACDLGLGYLTLGQSSSTLSGGECQRLKLAEELASHSNQHSVYILDEPTTGLHRADVVKLVAVLRGLVEKGNTIFVIEHDPDILKSADYIVELGPAAGKNGGKLIFQGTFEKLTKQTNSPWGKYWERQRIGGVKRDSTFVDTGSAGVPAGPN